MWNKICATIIHQLKNYYYLWDKEPKFTYNIQKYSNFILYYFLFKLI